MEFVGSLAEFLEKGPKIESTRPQTAFKSPRVESREKQKKFTLADRLDLISRQYESRPSGYIYQTPSRTTFRAVSANPGKRHQKVSSKTPTRPQTSNSKTYTIVTPDAKTVKMKNNKESVSVSLQEQVRNELLLKNKHYIIRSMKKIMRTDEQNKESGEKAKNTLFGRLAKRFENPAQQFKEREIKNPVQTENLIQKMSVVKDKDIAADRKPWLKKRGLLGHNEDIDFAKTIFRLLQQNGEVKSSALINLLATMGIPLPIFLIKQCLVFVFKPKNIDSYSVSENSMMSLCKTDEFERNIMSVFVHSLMLMGKNSINSIENPLSNTNKVILSSHDIHGLLKDWWSELDSMRAHQIHINEVSEFLQKKSIVVDANEGRKFLAKFRFHGTFLDFNQFLLIFAKFIVKNSLRTLCFRLAEDYQSSDFFSNDYTLTLMRKKIVFAGIKYPVPEFSAEEGASAISHIKKISNCQEFNDFDEYLAVWGKNLRHNKSNKDNNEEKKRELAVVHWESKFEEDKAALNNEKDEKTLVFGISDKCTILGNSHVHGQTDGQWKHSIAPKFAPFIVQRL